MKSSPKILGGLAREEKGGRLRLGGGVKRAWLLPLSWREVFVSCCGLCS